MSVLKPFVKQSVDDRIKQLLMDPDTFATTLLVICVDLFGFEMLGAPGEEDGDYEDPWAAETIRAELYRRLGVNLPACNLDKIMSLVAVLTTDLFYNNVDRFIRICNILSGDELDPGVFDPADADEMAWAIMEVFLNDPPESDQPFCSDIQAYMGIALQNEGFINAPETLRFAKFESDADPLGSWADDPDMYQAAYENQISKSQDISAMLRQNMAALLQQLEGLPLRNGKPENLIATLKKNLS